MNTVTLQKELETKVKARFQDCDPFNHLNNSKYIDYMINAREDQILEHYQFDVHGMARKQGVSWVVAQHQIAYIAPARVMETVVIQTRLLSFNARSIMIEAVMWNEGKTHVKAVLWSRQVHYDIRAGKSHEHSEELMGLFGDICFPLEPQLTFEDRVKSLKPSGRHSNASSEF